ncbi:NACHT domain-containing protein [Micromonospora coriariae]|uniref:NACHT domain-containing protein n=1 Tax=Micromonospora coriariae TaxID=285665 RepID=A0A1C4Y3E5_9ACTN|nr:NACHT domain-containing protein [Micromonospora coriariae]SCF15190.1 NACHT domain-containing protein [Micromonospora coriariae]
MIDVALGGLAKAIVTRVAGDWLRHRSAKTRPAKGLVELIEVSFADRFVRREFSRQVESVCDQIEQRLIKTWDGKFRYLDKEERKACIQAVIAHITLRRTSDRDLFEADMDAVKLAQNLRRAYGSLSPHGLSDEGEAFFDRLLVDSCDYLIRVAQLLPDFGPRVDVEILGRLTALSDEVRQVLARMPRSVRTNTVDEDASFLQSYLSFISEDLDTLDLIGVDAPDDPKRATLSVAYLGLTVSASRPRPARESGTGRHWFGSQGKGGEHQRSRIEDALGKNRLTVIRGEAGSGKTTLLKWLAVTAARSSFVDSLVGWNSLVPVLLTLRRFDSKDLPDPSGLVRAAVPAIAAEEPADWAARQLRAGRLLILVDGVDELAASRRRTIAAWLGQLARLYDAHVLVTTRPAAVPVDWLEEFGFKTVMLEPMNRLDVRVFIRQWHQAVWHASRVRGREPDRGLVEAAERRIMGQLDARPHLRNLATTPLLCALLCALNFTRRGFLPPDRMEIYRAALDMLELRETERELPRSAISSLTMRQRQYLLQGLAWRLAERANSEVSKERAIAWTESRLRRLPVAGDLPSASSIIGDFVARSGLLREPVPGRIDFIHRSFLEFLAGKEAAEEEHLDLLVDKAHLDQWREIVIMTAGHGGPKLQGELLDGILDRAEREPRRARTLRLLAISCMETATSLTEGRRKRLEECLGQILPPRNAAEARSLSSAGEHLLTRLPNSLAENAPTSAAAVIRTVVHIGGEHAIAKLKLYRRDSRPAVVAQLISGWDYFDAEEYAKEILADSPLIDGGIESSDPRQVRALRHLRNLRTLTAIVDLDSVEEATKLPQLTTLVVRGRSTRQFPVERLAQLPSLDALHSLVMETPVPAEAVAYLADLPSLRRLHVTFADSPSDLSFLNGLPKLEALTMKSLRQVTDLAALEDLDKLRELSLWHLAEDSSIRLDRLARGLEDLTLVEYYGTGLGQSLSALTELRRVRVLQSDGLRSVAPLATLKLTELVLRDCDKVAEVSTIGSITTLESLALIDCGVSDLDFLARLPRLRDLYLRLDDPFDPTVLGPRQQPVRVHLVGGQQLVPAEVGGLPTGVQVRRLWNVVPSWDHRRGWVITGLSR